MALRSRRFPALLTVLALVLVLVPLAGTAEAKRGKPHRSPRAAAAPKVVGQPPRNYVILPGSYFSFPNRSKAERMAIRNRVLNTIRSVWGGPRTALGTPLPTNGTIRISTWSFEDMAVARALVEARNRGVSVQVVAAKDANKGHPSWRWLRKKLGSATYKLGHPETRETVSFARVCRGACRGRGGTAHAKYFLFNNVGATHARNVVVQTSMNLTTMAFKGQWNQAQVMHSTAIYADFLAVFRQARLALPLLWPYHAARLGPVINYFFPRPGATAAQDPIMANLNTVGCQFAVPGVGVRRTVVRVIQYAIYSNRGVYIAKKLRALWDAGCDVAVIYSLATRPVLRVLGSRAGRGPVPTRQSVIKDGAGNIVKYNHSKWLAIAGRVGTSNGEYVTLSGSANWSDLAFSDDEQTQRINGKATVARHFAAFATTWRQKSSRRPKAARVMSGGRLMVTPLELPAEEPTFGKGIYRYLTSD